MLDMKKKAYIAKELLNEATAWMYEEDDEKTAMSFFQAAANVLTNKQPEIVVYKGELLIFFDAPTELDAEDLRTDVSCMLDCEVSDLGKEGEKFCFYFSVI